MALTDSDLTTEEILKDFGRTVTRHGAVLERLDRQHPGLLAFLSRAAVPAAGSAGVPPARRLGEHFIIPQTLWTEANKKFSLNDPGMETHAVCLHGRRILAEHAVGNQVFVPAAECEARRAACAQCPWNKGGACKQARCTMSAIIEVTTKYATCTCPLGRWPKTSVP